jgi:hypothetical protein
MSDILFMGLTMIILYNKKEFWHSGHKKYIV